MQGKADRMSVHHIGNKPTKLLPAERHRPNRWPLATIGRAMSKSGFRTDNVILYAIYLHFLS